jgi:phosphonopyruvate decarboxylase
LIVADSVFSSVDQYLSDQHQMGTFNRWVVPSERSIPAVAAGRWLATGKPTVMLMQNSGFSNAMDYLRTVLQVHKIPGLVISGWRGYDAQKDESEPHILVGQNSENDAINTLGKEHVFGHINGDNLFDNTRKAIEDALKGNVACLNISPQGFQKTYPLRSVNNINIPFIDMPYYTRIKNVKGRSFNEGINETPVSRDEALWKIHREMESENPFYIIGNGFNPRAMQALRISKNTFENAGGMGSSLAMAWGAAKSNPKQVFVAIDGDQNAVMNEMEKVLCSDYPENLYWYIINNGTGESVGTSLSLPLAPWHYELSRVINTYNEKPDTFNYPRINASGLKFDSPEAQELALRIGNLPAQAALAREILANLNSVVKP